MSPYSCEGTCVKCEFVIINRNCIIRGGVATSFTHWNHKDTHLMVPFSCMGNHLRSPPASGGARECYTLVIRPHIYSRYKCNLLFRVLSQYRVGTQGLYLRFCTMNELNGPSMLPWLYSQGVHQMSAWCPSLLLEVDTYIKRQIQSLVSHVSATV